MAEYAVKGATTVTENLIESVHGWRANIVQLFYVGIAHLQDRVGSEQPAKGCLCSPCRRSAARLQPGLRRKKEAYANREKPPSAIDLQRD